MCVCCNQTQRWNELTIATPLPTKCLLTMEQGILYNAKKSTVCMHDNAMFCRCFQIGKAMHIKNINNTKITHRSNIYDAAAKSFTRPHVFPGFSVTIFFTVINKCRIILVAFVSIYLTSAFYDVLRQSIYNKNSTCPRLSHTKSFTTAAQLNDFSCSEIPYKYAFAYVYYVPYTGIRINHNPVFCNVDSKYTLSHEVPQNASVKTNNHVGWFCCLTLVYFWRPRDTQCGIVHPG